MTNRAVAHARLRNSRLVGPPLERASDVVRWFGAVQSQDLPGALWALAQRMPPGQTIEELGAALDGAAIVRVHALRPTWHFLVPADLRWIQALTGPRVHQVNGTMYRRLGLGPAEFDAAESLIRSALAGGRALTRDELASVVSASGIDLADSLVITHLAMYAELEAIVCNGPRRGKAATYRLVDERVAATEPRDREDALRDLTIRYFQSHGPALDGDMAWWSGLTVRDVRRGLELAAPTLAAREFDGRAYWAPPDGFAPAEPPAPHVLLLSNYDEYLGSYVDYSAIFDAALPKARTVADVLGTHIVIRDGLVVGGWRRSLGARRAALTITLLERFSAGERAALDDEIERYRSFVGQPVDVRVIDE
jgi:hypothetical protein